MSNASVKLSWRILLLSTLAFMICFSAWMINGVLVTFLVEQGVFKWSPIQIGWLLGIPVLVGSIFRLPVGILTDKYGGRWIMTIILVFSAIPMFFYPRQIVFIIYFIEFWVWPGRYIICSWCGL